MNREIYIVKIIELLTSLERKIELRGSLNLRDINYHCENFYRDLLNIVYELNLINLNSESNNQDTIDLADKKAKKAYQVTASVTRAKVSKTLKGFNEKYTSDYTELFVLFI